MKKIYCLFVGTFENDSLYGVYSNKKVAEAWRKRVKNCLKCYTRIEVYSL